MICAESTPTLACAATVSALVQPLALSADSRDRVRHGGRSRRGDFVIVNGQPIFDAVSGVACSVRGHNPATYAEEMEELGSRPPDCRGGSRGAPATNLTGFGATCLPAVSGATAVENALKVALVAQFPKRHVLALKAGFGGKTLLALTGTANPSYKEHIDPLYADVHYVDPFASDARGQIEAVLNEARSRRRAGGIDPGRRRRASRPGKRDPPSGGAKTAWGYLLLVDEVQTGMYRTGPFTLSGALGLTPDLLAARQGHFGHDVPVRPDALLRGGARNARTGAARICPMRSSKRYGYEHGYRTVAQRPSPAPRSWTLSRQVAESGALFAELLDAGLASCKAVREVRVFGLLIGIELEPALAAPLVSQAAFLVLPVRHAPPRRLPRAGGLLPV